MEKTSELFFRPRPRSWVVNGVQWKGVVGVELFMSLEQEQWWTQLLSSCRVRRKLGNLEHGRRLRNSSKQGHAAGASICTPASPFISEQLKWRDALSMCRQGT